MIQELFQLYAVERCKSNLFKAHPATSGNLIDSHRRCLVYRLEPGNSDQQLPSFE